MGNLLQNAMKFTRKGTSVTLTVDASADRVLIEVQDECGGLSEDRVEELFRPFEQRGANRSGLGLGLAFSRWGAEANNGRVYARNLPGRMCVYGRLASGTGSGWRGRLIGAEAAPLDFAAQSIPPRVRTTRADMNVPIALGRNVSSYGTNVSLPRFNDSGQCLR